ncbi:hypothetical protein BXT84_12625 [Sulfobacillus thermotolerans]|uniref:Tyr recombinase domain-containing protein n=1 Tax=Sulfobacillus thermotolerans TaxID=338644 RepID=A0ABN5H3N4_9FIRM|nr:hypothetical protein BXT84_12625 [Sulfobacillus thermotolerans]
MLIRQRFVDAIDLVNLCLLGQLRLSSDAVECGVALMQHAIEQAPSLKSKQMTPHVLRHTAAMTLLKAAVASK